MSFGFSKQKSGSQQTADASSLSLGGNVSSSFGVGGSQSVSDSIASSLSSSQTGGQSSSTQGIAFQDLFSQLYGGANAAAGLVNTQGLSATANQLFSGGTKFLDMLGGNPGTDALQARIGDTSARDAQLGALQSGLGDLFNEQLLPGITGQGVSTGTLGGSREAVAQSLAAKQVAQAAARDRQC